MSQRRRSRRGNKGGFVLRRQGGDVQRNSPPWNSNCSSGSARRDGAFSTTGFEICGDGGASRRDLAGDDERRQQCGSMEHSATTSRTIVVGQLVRIYPTLGDRRAMATPAIRPASLLGFYFSPAPRRAARSVGRLVRINRRRSASSCYQPMTRSTRLRTDRARRRSGPRETSTDLR